MHICCAGEVMVEMAAESPGHYRRGVAGDSYNTAVYLARSGLHTSYLTHLGDDPMSDAIVQAMQSEDIDTRFLRRCAGRQPGLYTIDNDARGERSFSYWREHSPARELFREIPALAGVEAFYFTGITLAVNRTDLANLLDTLDSLRRANCRILFDPNYRPALWPDPESARADCLAVLPYCDMVLPTLADDRLLWGLEDAQASLAFYRDQGAEEIVLKGDDLCTHVLSTHVLSTGGRYEQRAEPVAALDTTGAGDAFNAGYLSSRLKGGDIAQAVDAAQSLAAKVVLNRGAILPRNQ